MGEANLYVWFGSFPQTISNQTQVKVLVSMNADPINTNKNKSEINDTKIKIKSRKNDTLKKNVGLKEHIEGTYKKS